MEYESLAVSAKEHTMDLVAGSSNFPLYSPTHKM